MHTLARGPQHLQGRAHAVLDQPRLLPNHDGIDEGLRLRHTVNLILILIAECTDYFSKSLFVVGEFGCNDYNAPLFSGVAFSDVKTNMPLVAKAIVNGDVYAQLGYKYLQIKDSSVGN
jgi:hypothetical protein